MTPLTSPPGLKIFKKTLRFLRLTMPRLLALLSLCVLNHVAAEDQITMENQDLFIGKIIALKNDFIEFQSPHSAKPLKVLNKELVQLDFKSQDSGTLPKNSQILHLHNGDQLPGEITLLNETHLHFHTWFADTLEVPRHLIDSIHFGVTPQKLISKGPKRISDWTQDQAGGWTLRNGALISSKSSFIGKNLNLPRNFIFGAQIAWKNTPNLRIHICSDQLRPNEKETSNSYLIAITRNGINVKRVMPKNAIGPSYQTLITHATNLLALPSKTIRLELRANRDTRTLHLYLNGHELEQGLDPAVPPTGTHVLFESLNTTRSNSRISKLALHEWDTSTQLLHLEPRESDKVDTLSVSEGDRFSGSITSFQTQDSSPCFTVKSPLSPDPIHIPLSHCSIIYFAKSQKNPPSDSHYRLDLRTGGQLSLSNILLEQEELSASHPWLGKLQIKRQAMGSIYKNQ